jgi:hypothetical protein
MPNAGMQTLTGLRMTRVIQSLQDRRDLPAQLKFLNRTPVVNATDAEITARLIGRVQIADIIADDAAAATYSFGRYATETVNIPNLKLGVNLTQSQINQLNQFAALGMPQPRGGTTGGYPYTSTDPLTMFYGRMSDSLLLGIRQRMESLLVAMHLDSFAYDRFGVKLSGVTWGMPSDLKVTPVTTWDNITATGVTDLLTLKRLASVRYGVNYNRATMSTDTFIYLSQQTEFINRARLFFNLNPTISGNVLPLQNTDYMRTLAVPILGMEIELYDSRYWTQASDGTLTSQRFLPVNQVILSSTEDDNDPMAVDFANAVCVESQVAGLIPTGAIGALPPAGTYGPISYATASDAQLNPPGITAWGVARGWPRKWVLQHNAVLTVGTFGDVIATGVAFPS